MTFKLLLSSVFLLTACAKGAYATEFSRPIDRSMYDLDIKGIDDTFRVLTHFVEAFPKEKECYKKRIQELQPWSVLSGHVWHKTPLFDEVYAPFLEARAYLLEKFKEKALFKEQTNFLLQKNLPLPENSPPEFESYMEQARVLFLMTALKDGNAPLTITPKRVFKFAIRSNDMPAAIFLMNQYKSDHDILKKFLLTSIMLGHKESALVLLKKSHHHLLPLDPNDLSKALNIASQKDHDKILFDLIEGYPQFFQRNTKALHIACENGCQVMVDALVKSPELLNIDTSDLFVALRFTYFRKTNIAETLISSFPALLTGKRGNGENLLHITCRYANATTILERINKHPSLLEEKTIYNETPLDILCDNHEQETLREIQNNEHVQKFVQENMALKNKIDKALKEEPYRSTTDFLK